MSILPLLTQNGRLIATHAAGDWPLTALVRVQKSFGKVHTSGMRRGLAAIGGPRASVLLRCGKTTPYIVLSGSLAVRIVQATLVAAIAVAVQFAPPTLLSAEEVGRPALMIEIDGAIGPATARYVKEALTTAGERRAGGVILRLDTPSGLAPTLRE